jgi:iron complex transport system substrate-binding protein
MMKILQHCIRYVLIASLALASLARAEVTTTASTRTVTYYGDRQVTVPLHVTRIATSWEAQNAIIAMLGHGNQIVATTRFVRDMPVFREFVPHIKDVPLAAGGAGGDLNIEELMRLHPQVLFLSSEPSPARAAQLQRAGIAVAAFRANAVDALIERVVITGEILGADAERNARRYQAYFAENVARVKKVIDTIPADKRVRLYHAVGAPLSTSGRPSLNQDWMDLAGVTNVAQSWFATKNSTAPVSIEQVIAADPDMIVAMRAEDAQLMRQDARWKNLRAVKSGRVFANPKGMFWWCRETSEVALQFLWLAKTAYPDYFKHIDMRDEVRYFYKTFYGYTLTDAQVEMFLQPPA